MIGQTQALDFARGAVFHITEVRASIVAERSVGHFEISELAGFNANWAADDLVRASGFLAQTAKDSALATRLSNHAPIIRDLEHVNLGQMNDAIIDAQSAVKLLERS